MQTPLEISFTNTESSPAVEARVRERSDKLVRLYGRITSCHVYIEAPPRQHRKDNRFEVKIETRVPGTELAVSNRTGRKKNHQDIYIALRDAFNAMERQLKKWRRQVQGEVKSATAPLQGRVAELSGDFGQIAATDGRLVYFHRNSVIGNGFDDLKEGTTVALVVQETEGDKGPQASTVRPIGPLEFVDERGR